MRFALSQVVALFLPLFCVANPEADPQQLTNNAPFSGAIYIVDPNGQQITTANTNMCPSSASVSCSTIGQPSWCCPNSYTCSSPANANGMIGCCPAGSSCGGAINVASVSTITVQAQQQTAIVYAQPPATTSVVYTQSTQDVHQQGFCSTLTAAGPGLPTTRQGDCGVILVVSEGTINLKALGYGTGVVFVLLHLALKRMFSWA